MSRIYKITDRTNNKIYIGQTSRDIYKRFAEHINKALNPSRPNDGKTALSIAIKNHDPKNFYVELLEEVEGTPKEIDSREIYWIKSLKSNNPDFGYNVDKGGHEISEACRKAAEPYLYKKGRIPTEKEKETARNNGMKVAKQVMQIDKYTGEVLAEFPSIIQASRETGCDRRSIQRQLSGEYNTGSSRSFANLKFIWRYKE